LLHALRVYETFYNQHRPHQGIANARPLAPLPEPIDDGYQLARLTTRRRDRLGGIIHETSTPLDLHGRDCRQAQYRDT
jgi:putative transposase